MHHRHLSWAVIGNPPEEKNMKVYRYYVYYMYRSERRSWVIRIDQQISFIMFFRSDFYYGHYYLSGEELKVILCGQGLSIELDWDEMRWESEDN